MLRLRRQRVYLIFAAIFIIAFLQFRRARTEWHSEVLGGIPLDDHASKPDAPDVPASGPKTTPEESKEKPSRPKLPAHEGDSDPDKTPHKPPPVTDPKDPSAGDKGKGRTFSRPYDEVPLKYAPPFNEGSFGPGSGGRHEASYPPSDQRVIHWEKQKEHFPVEEGDIIPLPMGLPKMIPKLQAEFDLETPAQKQEREEKLAAIKDSFQHSWKNYKEFAIKRDELIPVSGGGRDPFMGWGATLVDALDTLWIVGMKQEFEDALKHVKTIDFTTSQRKDLPLFETVIRYLGGLLGAYDISGGQYHVLLEKAEEVAEILIGAFDTPNRMPMTNYHWAPAYTSQPHRAGTQSILAELGTLSMEFTRLAQLTSEDKYYDAIARVTNELEKWQDKTRLPGLWPMWVDASGCKKQQPEAANALIDNDEDEDEDKDTEPASYEKVARRGVPQNPKSTKKQGSGRTSSVSGKRDCDKQGLETPVNRATEVFGMGGRYDSTYEYLPKEYMLLGGLNDQYQTMYEKAMKAVKKHLLFTPMTEDDRDIRFTASVTALPGVTEYQYSYKGSHLVCFIGAMVGMGAKVFGEREDLKLAAQLTDACVWAYESTTTGIMPETFDLVPCANLTPCAWDADKYQEAVKEKELLRFKKLGEAYDKKQKDKGGKKGDGKPALKSAPNGKTQQPNDKTQQLNDKTQQPNDKTKQPNDKTQQPVEWSHMKRGLETLGEEIAEELGERYPLPTASPTPASKDHQKGRPSPTPSFLTHEDVIRQQPANGKLPPGFTDISSPKYILRPEAIESVFVMYRLTGDNSWRQKGWQMFKAIEKHTRTAIANSGIEDVMSEKPEFTDVMESFWLGETLKYFYLLFSDPTLVSLDDYVLNTEAHPFKRPGT